MNITKLSQGNLDGVKRQMNECIDNAYRKGHQKGYKDGYSDGLNDIWDMIREVGSDMSLCCELYDTRILNYLWENYSAERALKIFNEYKLAELFKKNQPQIMVDNKENKSCANCKYRPSSTNEFPCTECCYNKIDYWESER